MAPRLLTRLTLGLVGLAVAQAIAAAPLADQTGRPRPALASDWVQECLDTDARIIDSDEGLDARGSLRRETMSAAVSTRSPAELAKRLASCMTHSQSSACPLPAMLRQPLAIDVIEGEAHPAWDANDRARIVDLVPAELKKLGETNHRIAIADARARSESPLRLTARIEYTGSGLSQRFADQWLVPTRALRVHLSLADRSARSTLAEREIEVKLPWRVRPRHAETSSAEWITQTLDIVRSGAREMLAPLECAPDVLATTRTPSGQWQLDIAGREGLEKGRTVLLVPADESLIATRWPVARVMSVNGTRNADIEFLRGDETACAVGGCTALVL